ncbi:glycosyltransferase [Aquabacterium parvum]|uniref:glycosyltransferase n=1 Tax=Aquabacterium parvum TaxID=70584 RepID=UPI000718F11B|nr:glycosyltransferase [Aquabacterium parvum]MBU0915057.1 glycosyltransferase [Gammaproteobacteria bacterium]
MRIVHVLHSHGYGGAESHALLMMKLQREAGHEVCYAGPMDSWLGSECEKAGIAFEHIPMHGLFDLWSHWKLRALLKRWHADIVHGHLIRGAMYAGRAGHRQRAPLAICTAHATTARTHMQRCAHIIAVSGAVRDGLLAAGYAERDVSLVYNGVPEGPVPPSPEERAALRAELGIPVDAFAVVHVGRFVRDKGQDLLVQAMRSVPAGVHLYLVGDPATEFGREVQALLTTEPALAARVHCLGFRPDVQRLLPAFDAFALASRREALSIAVIEAFAARVPVVATRVGGVPEIVRHEDTGLLVPTENAAALAQGITRLYQEQLTARSMLDRTLALYQRCLGRAA